MIENLLPRKKALVFDLVAAAGHDMTDWIESSNDPRGHKANPKYCFDWAFVQPGRAVVLNLWHQDMVSEDDRIVQRGNYRSDAAFHLNESRKTSWLRRALFRDEALQQALRDNLPVRVIVNDGQKRPAGELAKPSSVSARELDPELWTITKYNWKTGAFELTRGILATRFVDQFDLDQAEKGAERQQITTSTFIRDPAVRVFVKQRAAGRCELCGNAGFPMKCGALYLETHHVIPLSENGTDTISNVVALCANDHRRAHHGEDAIDLRIKLLAILAQRNG